MRVIVTGGTGFTGEFVLRALAARGIEPTVLVRGSSDRSRLADMRLQFAEGDLGVAVGASACPMAVMGIIDRTFIKDWVSVCWWLLLGLGFAAPTLPGAQDYGKGATLRGLHVLQRSLFSAFDWGSKSRQLKSAQPDSRHARPAMASRCHWDSYPDRSSQPQSTVDLAPAVWTKWGNSSKGGTMRSLKSDLQCGHTTNRDRGRG